MVNAIVNRDATSVITVALICVRQSECCILADLGHVPSHRVPFTRANCCHRESTEGAWSIENDFQRFCVGKSLPRASIRQAARISYSEKLFSIRSKPVLSNFNLYNYIILRYMCYVIIVIILIFLDQKIGPNTSNENL